MTERYNPPLRREPTRLPPPRRRMAAPEPDAPSPSRAPQGLPSPDTKPEVGPMGEPPGVPSPAPTPKHDGDLPQTIDPVS